MPDAEKQRYTELSDFLKSRRARILPTQVGLVSDGRRRTSGLRREEVAQLAGIGLTWYTWLEQGRPIHVSAQVLESLSRVLMLDRQERAHLFLLANQPLPEEPMPSTAAVSPLLQHFLDTQALCPSFIADTRWNVIAWNSAARAVFGEYEAMNARQRNVVWAMFTDEYYKNLFADWEKNGRNLVGRFRAACGKFISDPWLEQFISDLSEESPEFKRLWPLHELQSDFGLVKRLIHPTVGELLFESNSFDVPDAPLKLFVHVPVENTETAEKIKTLTSIYDAAFSTVRSM